MHKAAEGGQLKMIKFLSQTFASRVHEGDSNGFTMLHFAARRGHYEVVCYLIEEVKMDPQGRDKVCGMEWEKEVCSKYRPMYIMYVTT